MLQNRQGLVAVSTSHTTRCFTTSGTKPPPTTASSKNDTTKGTKNSTVDDAGKQTSSDATSTIESKTSSKVDSSSSTSRKESKLPTDDVTTTNASTTILLPPPPPPSSPSSSASSSTIESSMTTSKSLLTNALKQMQDIVEESSGLSELTHLKQKVQDASTQFDVATKRVAELRDAATQAQKAHELAHKKHVSLLMRRDDWNADDAQAFVSITSDEVMTRQALLEVQDGLRRAEDAAINGQHLYMDAMRQRYHEEQMWQDKWRLFGTYGTWSLIGINTLVFLGGQYSKEKREMRRLQHMEALLIQSQEEAATRTDESLKKYAMLTGSSSSAGGGADADSGSNGNAQITDEGEDKRSEETGSYDKHARDSHSDAKASPQSFTGLSNLHAPSVALGAAISVSLVLVVSLLSSR